MKVEVLLLSVDDLLQEESLDSPAVGVGTVTEEEALSEGR
jgi:hypothetical protein